MSKNNNIVARDKRGRILPQMNRENLAEMLNLPLDASVRKCIKIAEHVMKYNPILKYNLRAMCRLEDNAPTGLIKRKMKQYITR